MKSNVTKRSFNLLPLVSLLTMLALLGVQTGCSKQQGAELKTWIGDLWSNRPQNRDRFMAIVKFSEPALLKSASFDEEGKLVISDEAKEKLLKEQKEKIEELKALASGVKILYTYRFTLNGVAFVAPLSVFEKVKGMAGIAYIENSGTFHRPVLPASKEISRSAMASLLLQMQKSLQEENSATFIGADRVHKEFGLNGKGLKVGVLDTGIDYTHAMFGGAGTVEAYKAINPSGEAVGYPNQKIVGGIDLVGTPYDAGSPLFDKRIPAPDNNPIDEGGHGSHVAGTVAGKGDGVESYDGVAPEADLYAIKVFGADGSTSDTVVIAGMEFSMDPNGDLDPSDRLDVLNLSLGSSYGKPGILYSEAISNLKAARMILAASAGNSGHEGYIVGAPSTSDDAFSVAASVDNMPHNWQFNGAEFFAGADRFFVEAIEAGFSKPLSDVESLKEEMVYVGTLVDEPSDSVKERLKGKVALIDRGVISFFEKVSKAQQLGAVAAVVANNREGAPFAMGGGDGKLEIPAMMIEKSLGEKLKFKSFERKAFANLTPKERIQKPELIDTITGFSSQGPRSLDGAFKPEISTPGESIMSAGMGLGAKTVKMSGTSMAAPHMAGVLALVKERHPLLSVEELKALVMGTAKIIKDEKGVVYPWSKQGAGRADVYAAVTGKALFLPGGLSFGEQQVLRKKTLARTFKVKNITKEELKLKLVAKSGPGLDLSIGASEVALKAGEVANVTLRGTLSVQAEQVKELNALVEMQNEAGEKLAHLPVLAVVTKTTQLAAQELKVFAGGEEDEAGALASLTLVNKQTKDADEAKAKAYVFNWLGSDSEIPVSMDQSVRARSCDLAGAGYRVIEKADAEGVVTAYLQFAVKLHNPVTRWQGCEVSVLFDKDGDGDPEQELGGIMGDNLPGLNGNTYQSVLLDSVKARELRRVFEQNHNEGKDEKEDYTPAIVEMRPMLAFNNSGISIVEVPLDLVTGAENRSVNFKLQILNEDGTSKDSDDVLNGDGQNWHALTLGQGAQGLQGLEESYSVPAEGKVEVDFQMGQKKEDVVVFFPYNRWSTAPGIRDSQMSLLTKKYQH